MVETDDTLESAFSVFLGLANAEKSFVINRQAVICSNELFDRLKTIGKSLGKINEDKTDYRSKVREITDPVGKQMCIEMVGIKRLAVTTNKNLDDVFEVLFK